LENNFSLLKIHCGLQLLMTKLKKIIGKEASCRLECFEKGFG